MSSDLCWWKVEFSVNNEYSPAFYIRAKNVERTSEHGINIDGHDLVYEGTDFTVGDNLGQITKSYSLQVIEHTLDSYFHLKVKNDTKAWLEMENIFPGVTCVQHNTPETVDRHVLRFKFKDTLYEYNPRTKHLSTIRAVEQEPQHGKCVARQYSDQMICEVCNLVWDRNDPDPPRCKYEER